MMEVWQKSFIYATIAAGFFCMLACVFWFILTAIPSLKIFVKSVVVILIPANLFVALFIILTGPYSIMTKASNTVTSETKYTITAVSPAADNDQLNLTIKDDNGKTTTVTTQIDEFEIAEDGDFFTVTEYETHRKSYAIVYTEKSAYADVFDAFRIRQEIMD